MTAFAKMLVFMQFIFGVVFATWVIMLFALRIDWAPGKTLAGEPIPERQGRIKELATQIEEQVEYRNVAEARWVSARAALDTATKNREDYQAYYSDQLSLVKKGEDTKGRRLESPVRQFAYNPDGSLITDPKNRPPVTSFGQPVKSVDEFQREKDEFQKQIEKAQDDYGNVVKEASDLAAEIAGTPGKYGLREDLRREISYFRNCLDEMLDLEPKVNARSAELEAVQRRNAQLKSRVRELEANAAANR